MHRDESAVTEYGDDTLSRRKMTHSRSVFSKITIKVLSLLLRPGKFKRFRPDLTVDDGYDQGMTCPNTGSMATCSAATYFGICETGRDPGHGGSRCLALFRTPASSCRQRRASAAHHAWDGSPAVAAGRRRDRDDSPVPGELVLRGTRDAQVSPHPSVP